MLTGEPDAGDPHVRFGGRGGAIQCVVPTPILDAVVGDNERHEFGSHGEAEPC